MMPQRFCWAKFGAEAGEEPEAIIRRKEAEGVENQGLFLWGIGHSIRPSLLALIDSTTDPVVVFTPMRSPAARHDRSPDRVGRWHRAIGIDGQPFDIPTGSIVTSGLHGRMIPTRHYALVCHSDTPLLEQANGQGWLDDNHLRNLRTGAPVGSSQVTSVVEQVGTGSPRRRYQTKFSAQLISPFQVTLRGCIVF